MSRGVREIMFLSPTILTPVLNYNSEKSISNVPSTNSNPVWKSLSPHTFGIKHSIMSEDLIR